MGTVSITATDVRVLIDSKLTDAELDLVIVISDTTYNSYLGTALDSNEPLQFELRRHLAAHYVTLKDNSTLVKSETIGDAKIEFKAYNSSAVNRSGSISNSLSESQWGRTAILLDPTGILVNLGGSPLLGCSL